MDSMAVTVTNDSSRNIFIAGDPNWDDQELTIDGQPVNRPYELAPGSSAVVGIVDDYNEVGVIFAGARDYDYSGTWFYQQTIGPDPDTGNLSVTDDNPFNSPPVVYTLADQAPLSMTMRFAEGSQG